MGNCQGKNDVETSVCRSTLLKLSDSQFCQANLGKLFATFDDCLEEEGDMTDYSGAFEELSKLRRGENKAPEDIKRLAEVCCEAWDEGKEEEQRKSHLDRAVERLFSIISLATGTTTSSKTYDSGRRIRSNFETLSPASKKAAGKIVNMFGSRGKHNETRAHQLPANPACNIFWGMVCEALAGINMEGFPEEKKTFVRCEMAHHLARFRMNLFAFGSPHSDFYDHLTNDLCVMIIPLLTLEEIADWKKGEGYEILFLCSSKEAHKMLGTWRGVDEDNLDENLDHMKWEDSGDLEKAQVVLTAYIKALADSLTDHWDSYFDVVCCKHKEFETKKKHMVDAKELLVTNNGRKVEVPRLKNVSMLHRKKLFKIDLGDLYNADEKDLIPDPSLFAFKAAVNWSGRKEDTRLRKLLSGCSPAEGTSDDELSSLGQLSFTDLCESAAVFIARHAEKVPREYEGQPGLGLLDQEVTIIVSESDNETSVSDVSFADFSLSDSPGYPVVSED